MNINVTSFLRYAFLALVVAAASACFEPEEEASSIAQTGVATVAQSAVDSGLPEAVVPPAALRHVGSVGEIGSLLLDSRMLAGRYQQNHRFSRAEALAAAVTEGRTVLLAEGKLDRGRLAVVESNMRAWFDELTLDFDEQEILLEGLGDHAKLDDFRAYRDFVETRSEELLVELGAVQPNRAALADDLRRLMVYREMDSIQGICQGGQACRRVEATRLAVNGLQPPEVEVNNGGNLPDTANLDFAAPPLETDEGGDVDSGIYQPDLPAPSVVQCDSGSTAPECNEFVGGEFTQLLIDKATELGNDPYAIYQFVRDEIRFDANIGIHKSAHAVLQTARGGVTEQCLLLGTLLRIAGHPANYAFGWVYVPVDDLRVALGHRTNAGAEAEVERRFSYTRRIDANSQVEGYYLYWSWVEAYVPYGKRYGELAQKRWVPLMPHWTTNSVSDGHGSTCDTYPFDEPAFLSEVRSETAEEFYRASLTVDLAAAGAGYGVTDVPSKATNVDENIAHLPASLPVEVVNGNGVSHLEGMPSNYYLKAFTVVHDPAGQVAFGYYLMTAAYGLKRLALTWEPASQADADIIASYGGLSATPANMVNLMPAYRADGELLASGTGMNYGSNFHLVMYFQQFEDLADPTNTGFFSERDKWRPVGTTYALVYDGFQYSPEYLAEREAALIATAQSYVGTEPADNGDDLAAELLYCAAVKYALDIQDNRDAASGLYDYRNLRQPSHMTTGTGVGAHYLFDRPFYVVPKSAVLDAWGLMGGWVAMDGDNSDESLLNRAYAWGSSQLEHMLWEYYIYVQSSSTTKLIQMANQTGMPVYDFAPYTDEATIRNSLQLWTSVEDTVVSDCAGGARVMVHQGLQYVVDWWGVGWFSDFADGGFGMMISGGIASQETNGAGFAGSKKLDQPSRRLAKKLRHLKPGDTGKPYYNGGAGGEENPEDKEKTDEKGEEETNTDEPVNLRSGNFYHREVDIHLPSVGYPLIFWRYYNSNLDYSGPMGNKWTHTYDCSLMPTAIPGELLYLDEMGGTSLFVETVAPGTYEGPAGTYAVVVYEAQFDQYVHRNSDGFLRFFDAGSGKMVKMEDSNGNARTLTYDVSGRLSNVNDDFGAFLSFAYDATDHVQTVTDNAGRIWTYACDAGGDLVSVTSPSDAQTAVAVNTYQYDSNSRLTGWVDPRGTALEVEYYADGRVFRQSPAPGFDRYFQFDVPLKNETVVTEFNGAHTSFRFDDSGNLVQQELDNGQVYQYVYDVAGNKTKSVDPMGYETVMTYDANGNLLSTTDAEGQTWSFTYEPTYNLTLTGTDERGVFVSMEYDAAGNVTSATDAKGYTATYTYDTRGNMLTATNPLGETVTFTYDSAGNLVSQSDPAGNTTHITYNALGLVSELQTPDGAISTFEYDLLGRLLAAYSAGQLVVQNQYDKNGNLTQVTDAGGEVSQMTYNGLNWMDSKTMPDGRLIEFDYHQLGDIAEVRENGETILVQEFDAIGQLISKETAGKAKVHFEYDAQGQIVAATDADGGQAEFITDSIGRVIEMIAADGSSKLYSYNQQGFPVSFVDQAGATTLLEYDNNLNLVSYEDTNQNAYLMSHDEANHLVSWTDPLGNQRTYTYDANGRPETETDARGLVREVAYNELSQPSLVILRDELGTEVDSIQFSHDALGRLLAVTDGDTSLGYDYDAAGLLTATHTAATLVQPATSVYYSHDAAGRRTTMTGPEGGAFAYQSDPLGRLLSLTMPSSQSIAFKYASGSAYVGIEFPNGSTMGRVFDGSGRLEAVVNKLDTAELGSATYSYDLTEALISATGPAGATNYAYDAAGRLESAGYPAALSVPDEAYTYDAVGNRLSDGVHSYAYDIANRLLSDGVYEYQYDADGNRTRKEAVGDPTTYTDYTYDHDDRLTSAVEYQGGLVTLDVAYAYDGLGRRVQKVVDGVTTRYVYDRFNIVAEYDGANALVARYTHGLETDDILAMERGGHTYYYHKDHLGSVLALTDEAGQVVQRYRYSAFGEVVYTEDPAFAQPFGFAGREQDETGLIYMRARYYDPAVGRFLQPDAAGLAAGPNLYSYVNNAPTMYSDPFGLWPPFLDKWIGEKMEAKKNYDSKTYSAEETQKILDNARKEMDDNWTSVGDVVDGCVMHGPFGTYDYKANEPNAEFTVPGFDEPLKADEFGNYIAGYVGEYGLGDFGVFGVKAAGEVMARIDSGFKKGDSDDGSAKFINRGVQDAAARKKAEGTGQSKPKKVSNEIVKFLMTGGVKKVKIPKKLLDKIKKKIVPPTTLDMYP